MRFAVLPIVRRLVAAACLICMSAPVLADNWTLRIATWNLLNFGDRKAGINPVANRALLIDKFADTIAQYDIVFLQEVLNNGASMTQSVAQRPQLANYNCQTLSAASGRIGRQERYSVCRVVNRPLAAGGGTLVLNGTDDFALGGPYVAANGNNQTAQNVWMRPPLWATFTFTPPPGRGAPFSFGLHSIHTKPAFGGAGPPPGTPANAANNRSVYYELLGLQQNLQAAPNRGVLGDLNTDCASYPQADRGQNFALGWQWYVNYGEKTNTAPLSSCAYDRVIFNPGLQNVKLAHGIYTLGIAAPLLNGVRVSDHYLVWVEIGRNDPPQPLLVASSVVPVAINKRQKLFHPAGTPGTSSIKINATNILQPSIGVTPMVYVMQYDQSNFFGGGRSIPLVDVRGAPTPVTIKPDGSLTADVVWEAPTHGIYALVLDVNGDGIYHKYSGDIVNSNDEIDFVVDDGPTHSQVVTVGDNGRAREIFNSNAALHVYAMARGLTPGAEVDVYVVANKLLPPGKTWETLRAEGTLNLVDVSVPVHEQHGPVMVTPPLAKADRVRTVTVAPDGSLFFSAWPAPYRLFNTRALETVADVPNDKYKPEYAKDDENGNEADRDACFGAWESTDEDLKAVCNVGNRFTDYYGNSFNIVIDVDRNGVFGPGPNDRVDTHDTGDLDGFFVDHTILDESANDNPAVGEYKEFLNAKLALDPPLRAGNTYDDATRAASFRYLCTPTLSRGQYADIVKPGAQIGFKVLDLVDYQKQRTISSGLYTFVDAKLDQATVPSQANICITSNDLHLNDLQINTGARIAGQAQNLEMSGNVTVAEDGDACMAVDQFTMTNGTISVTAALVPSPDPVTKGIAIGTGIAGGLGAVGSVLCHWWY